MEYMFEMEEIKYTSCCDVELVPGFECHGWFGVTTLGYSNQAVFFFFFFLYKAYGSIQSLI
jgi:hypothetical protein